MKVIRGTWSNSANEHSM